MPSIQERVTPQNIEAEMSVLGALLIDKEAIISIGDQMVTDDFYVQKHRHVFDIMLELYRKHEPIDILSLTNRLEEKKLLEEIGGRAYLIELANSVPTSSNVKYYSQIVQKKATLRRLIKAAQEITALGFDDGADDIEKNLDQAEQKLFSVSQKFSSCCSRNGTNSYFGPFLSLLSMYL